MNKPPYGRKSKKVIFYDTDKRYGQLKVRLKYDSLSQAQFFRDFVTGYINQDVDLLKYLEKVKLKKQKDKQTKKRVRENKKLLNSSKEAMSKLALKDDEIENIFDILEKENPNL